MSLDKNLLKKCKLLEEQDRGEWVSSKNLENTKQKAQTKTKIEKRIKKVYFELVVNTIGIITPDSYFFDNINNKWNYDFNDDNIIKKLTERDFYNKIKELKEKAIKIIERDFEIKTLIADATIYYYEVDNEEPLKVVEVMGEFGEIL